MTLAKVGISTAARMAMTAMTMTSSVIVNARRSRPVRLLWRVPLPSCLNLFSISSPPKISSFISLRAPFPQGGPATPSSICAARKPHCPRFRGRTCRLRGPYITNFLLLLCGDSAVAAFPFCPQKGNAPGGVRPAGNDVPETADRFALSVVFLYRNTEGGSGKTGKQTLPVPLRGDGFSVPTQTDGRLPHGIHGAVTLRLKKGAGRGGSRHSPARIIPIRNGAATAGSCAGGEVRVCVLCGNPAPHGCFRE